MDSDFNPSIKENFKRDDFMKKLDPAACEVQSEILIMEKKRQMKEG